MYFRWLRLGNGYDWTVKSLATKVWMFRDKMTAPTLQATLITDSKEDRADPWTINTDSRSGVTFPDE